MDDRRSLSSGLAGCCKTARLGGGLPASEGGSDGLAPRPWLPPDMLRLIDALARRLEREERLREVAAVTWGGRWLTRLALAGPDECGFGWPLSHRLHSLQPVTFPPTMPPLRSALASLALLLALADGAPCPPSGFDGVSPFSLADYVSRPWFIVQQASRSAQQRALAADCLSKSPNSYQSADALHCVRAEYRFVRGSSAALQVFNQGRVGSVSGPLEDPNLRLIKAVVVDARKGKLKVGPTFLPTSLYGPYWVVAAGPAPYEWAVISGGPPTVAGSTPGTCTNVHGGSFFQGNGEGLWLFSRQPQPNASFVQMVRAAAAAKGFDLSVLVDVPQSGCSYAAFPANRG